MGCCHSITEDTRPLISRYRITTPTTYDHTVRICNTCGLPMINEGDYTQCESCALASEYK